MERLKLYNPTAPPQPVRKEAILQTNYLLQPPQKRIKRDIQDGINQVVARERSFYRERENTKISQRPTYLTNRTLIFPY